MKKLLKYFISILLIALIIFFNNINVYAFKETVLWDAKDRTHTETVPEAGDVIEVPAEVDQTGADCAGTGIIRNFIKEKWDGSKDENGWCYLNVAGVNRYMVALAPLYGVVGDFVDIYITNNGVSTVYPCIIVDSKDVWEAFENEYPYVYNGKKYGHLSNLSGKCKIVEIVLDPYHEPQDLVDSLCGVTKIVNGGNIKEHPDGPVGLDGNYGSNLVSGNSNPFTKQVGQILKNFWLSAATIFENMNTGSNSEGVTYKMGRGAFGHKIDLDNFIQYYMGDSRWALMPFGNAWIGYHGCGPTAVATTLTNLSGREITPKDLIDWSGNTYASRDENGNFSFGSNAFGMARAAIEHFGLSNMIEAEYKDGNTNLDEIINTLRRGDNLIIVLVGEFGIFTNAGHYVVFAGVYDDGAIIVKETTKDRAENGFAAASGKGRKEITPIDEPFNTYHFKKDVLEKDGDIRGYLICTLK